MALMTPLVLLVFYMVQACQGTCPLTPNDQYNLCTGDQHHQVMNMMRVDFQLSQNMTAGNDVKNCPKMCRRCFYAKPILGIIDCETDPSQDLPKFFQQYKDQPTLWIALVNAVFKFPCEVLPLTQLEALYIVQSPLKTMPCNLSALKKLKLLLVQHTQLEILPSQLVTVLPSVSSFVMDHNAIHTVDFPSSAPNVKHMATLNLSSNSLTSFPGDILALSNLKFLDVSNNKLGAIPSNFSVLRELQWLNLRNTELDTMPSNLQKIPNLNCLDLSDNSLPNIPGDSLPPHLRGLWLSNTSSVNISQMPLGSVVLLDLSNNNLEVVPAGLIDLQYIKTLILSHNRLQTLNQQLTLQRLVCLDQSHNKMSSLLTGYYVKCLMLAYLLLDYNEIETIGSFPRNMNKKLQVGLSHNRLTSLDSWPLHFAFGPSDLKINFDYNSIAHFTNYDMRESYLECGLSKETSYISIAHNNITHIMDIFRGWHLRGKTTEEFHKCLDDIEFNISGNPLVCDCVDYDVYEYIHKSTRNWGLSCSEPKSLSGKDPLAISLDLFVCPVYEHCPLGCMCNRSPHTKSIQLMCADYTATYLPSIIPDLPLGSTYHLNFSHQRLEMVFFIPYLLETSTALFSHNAITSVSKEAFLALMNVEIVHLHNNLLKYLSEFENIVSVTMNSTRELTLSGNPWLCNCHALALRDWVRKNFMKIPDADMMKCHSPPSISGKKLIYLESTMFCPRSKSVSHILLGCGIGALLVVIVLVPIALRFWQRAGNAPPNLRPKFRPPPTDECEKEEKKFDVYVSYDDRDEEYVLEWLIPELELRGFKVCFQLLHADPCESVIYNLYQCINNSKRVLVFFSDNLKNDNMAKFEWNTAYDLDIDHGTARLVTILDWDVDVSDLEHFETQYFERCGTVIVREERDFWKCLAKSLAVERMGDPPVVDDEGHELPEVVEDD